MKIVSAAYVKGVTGTDDILYDGKFQVAFMGRSNVGKSTLINSLSMHPKLARASSTPGKTLKMDFFLINNSFYFVDFPGYGYAKTYEEMREKIRKMIIWYLLYSEITNRIVLLVIDAKVGMTDFDRDTLGMLRDMKVRHLIIANKTDNLKRNIIEKRLAEVRKECGSSEMITYSSETNKERETILELLSYGIK